MSAPTEARRLPARRRPGRCPGIRRRADSTTRAGLRSVPRRARRWRQPPMPRRGATDRPSSATPWASAAPDIADRRASRSSASPWSPSGRPEFDHAAAGSAPSANISAARSRTSASRRGADGAAAAAADDTAIPEARHVGEHVEGWTQRREDPCRPATMQTRRSHGTLWRSNPRRTAGEQKCGCQQKSRGAHASPPAPGDAVRPAAARSTRASRRAASSQPPAPPDSRKCSGSAPMSWPSPMPSTGRPAKTAAVVRAPAIPASTRAEKCSRSTMSRCAARIKRGDRQALGLRQPPEQSQPLPMRGQPR